MKHTHIVSVGLRKSKRKSTSPKCSSYICLKTSSSLQFYQSICIALLTHTCIFFVSFPMFANILRKPGTAIQIQNLKYAIWNSKYVFRIADTLFRIPNTLFRNPNTLFGILNTYLEFQIHEWSHQITKNFILHYPLAGPVEYCARCSMVLPSCLDSVTSLHLFHCLNLFRPKYIFILI